MTALSISTDLHINGLLEFGSDARTSGIRLPPRQSSTHYSDPAGKQLPGNTVKAGVGGGDQVGPGQLAFLLPRMDGKATTSRIFEFEPRDIDDLKTTSYLTVPARNGTVITTGNLAQVTKELGSMTSISVGGSSYLEGGLSVGDTAGCALKGQGVGSQTLAATMCNKPALVLQGSQDETIVHTAPIRVNETYARLFGRPHPSDAWATTKIGFQIQPASQTEVQFPATSGTVITTGNLEDITRFEGKLLNVSGPSHLRGPVTLGTNRSTPIRMLTYADVC